MGIFETTYTNRPEGESKTNIEADSLSTTPDDGGDDKKDNSQTGKNTMKISALEGELSGMRAQINMLMGQVI